MNKTQKQIITLFLALISALCMSQEKHDFIVLRINNIVGDTIDLSEKVRLDLFPDITTENYDFAILILDDRNIKLRVYDNSLLFVDYDYSAEQILRDNETIIQNQHRKYVAPKGDYNKVKIRLVDKVTNKSMKLRKRKTVDIKMKNHDKPIEVKIKDLNVSVQPVLKVRKMFSNGEKIIVPLSEIEYINSISKTNLIMKRIISVMYLTIAVIATASDPLENYGVGIFFGSIGTFSVLYRNHKFDISNCDIQIIYR